MKLKELFEKKLTEMPRHTPREMDADDDEEDLPTPFFITDERLNLKYDKIGEKDNVEVWLGKTLESAIVGLRTTRHDKKDGIMLYGDMQFKSTLDLGFDFNDNRIAAKNVLQVNLVTVMRESKFMGLGTLLYSTIVQHGYILISDTHQFDGGRELWKKLGRSHMSNEVVYVIDRGHPKLGKDGKPIIYDGQNIPDSDIWSLDEKHMYILFAYQKK